MMRRRLFRAALTVIAIVCVGAAVRLRDKPVKSSAEPQEFFQSVDDRRSGRAVASKDVFSRVAQ